MSFRIARPGTGRRPLDAALARLAEHEPDAAARAAAALDRVLRDQARSALGEAAWQCSGLTPTGFPVELGVTSRRREVRWVAQQLPPEGDPAAALLDAELLACGLGATPLDDALRARLLRTQAGRRLAFGAWVGGRHGASHDRWKLYAELPAGLDWADLPDEVARLRPLLGGISTPRFVGLPLDGSGALEVYTRVTGTAADAPELLVGRSGLDLPADALRAPMDALGLRTPSPRNLGLSVVTDAAGGVIALALFAFARGLFGDDPTARARLLGTARSAGWASADLYDALSRPVGSGTRCHGPVSFVTHRDGTSEVHVGLAPPASVDRPVAARPSPEPEPCHV